MANRIVPTHTHASGVELIYLEDRDVAGINIRGLARLLECNPEAVYRQVKGVSSDLVFRAEIHTEGGLQGVRFILEEGVVQILEAIMDGKHKQETKDAAKSLYRRFARAGFKLYVMLQVAPSKLVAECEQKFPDNGTLVDLMFAGIVNEVTVSAQSRDFERIKQNLQKEHQAASDLLKQAQKVSCMADVLRKALLFNELVQHASFTEILQSEIAILQEFALSAEKTARRLVETDLSKTSRLYVLPDPDQHDQYRMP